MEFVIIEDKIVYRWGYVGLHNLEYEKSSDF